MKSISGISLAWVTWPRVWAGCLLAAAILYGVAFSIPQPGFVFSGFLLNSIDPWGYMAFSRCFAKGGFLIDNPFAPCPGKPAFFNLLWFLTGKAQAITGLGFLPVYYALGIVASGLMYAALWAFCREFLGEGPRARLAFLLACLGGGLGWIPALLSEKMAFRLEPIDLFHHEGFPLVSALFFPHFALSIAVLVTTLLWFYRGVTTGGRKWSVAAAGLFLSLGFFHPYHLVTIVAVTGAWVTVEQVMAGRRFFRGWLDLAVLGTAALPPVLYYRWFFRQPNWNVWAGANVIRSGKIGLLLGIGPILLLAAAGAWRGGQQSYTRHRFLLVWGLTGLGLLVSYPLIKFEAKLVEGLVVPLAVLGAIGLLGREDRCTSHLRLSAVIPVLLLLIGSPVLLVAKSLQVVRGNWRQTFFPITWTEGAYLHEGDLAVMRYLEKNPLKGGLLMVPTEEGRMLPGVADVRVFLASDHVTPDFYWRWKTSSRVYSAEMSPLKRYSMLKRVGVTHLWYSAVWEFSFTPETEPYLQPVFVERGAGIWRIVP